jgi:hypothetical protein
VFKYILISMVIVPLLIGVIAVKGRSGAKDYSALRIGWVVYAVFWFGTLYFLRHKWA